MDAASSEPLPLADAVRPATTPASLPAVLEDRLGAEVREGVRTLDGLGAAAPREAAALDELSRLNQLERQRQAEASIAPLSSGHSTVYPPKWVRYTPQIDTCIWCIWWGISMFFLGRIPHVSHKCWCIM